MKNTRHNKAREHGIYRWVLLKIHEISPHCIPLHLLALLINLIVIYLPIIGMRYLLAAVLEKNWTQLLMLAGGLYISLSALKALQIFLNYKLHLIGRRMNEVLTGEMMLHSFEVDYETVTSGAQKEGFRQALMNMSYEMGDFNTFVQRIMGSLENLLSIALSLLITVFLIMSVATKSPESPLLAWALKPYASLMIAISSLVLGLSLQIFMSQRATKTQRSYFEKHAKVEATLSYYILQVASATSQFGLYQAYDMLPMLGARMRERNHETSRFFSKQDHATRIFSLSYAAFSAVMLITGYSLSALKALYGAIPAAALITYAQSYIQLNTAISELMDRAVHLKNSKPYFADIRSYIELENKLATGSIPVEKRRDHKLLLELKDVSFHYPGSEELVLKNINLTLDMNRRHALVGPNGAGKSSLIYLISRLYEPSSGRILLNGVDIRKYDYEEYLSLFSVVFQDFQVFAMSLRENVACRVGARDEAVQRSLARAGFPAAALENAGLEAPVVDVVNAMKYFSGGELQKIAIARALYKDGSFVILDEPTAALDPKSEAEIYERLQEMIENKTTIFISHRMSSCRLCEDIIVLDEGEIVERGSHQQLMAEAGLYKEMWEAQAQYYR